MRTRTWVVIVTMAQVCATHALGQPLQHTWTTSADFEDDALIFTNVNVTDIPDQLQLNLSAIETPYLWIANSSDGSGVGQNTIAQVDSDDGRVIRTVQIYENTGTLANSPSRTAVDANFNCWVGYRGFGGINAVARLGAEDPAFDFLYDNPHLRTELGIAFDVWDLPRAVAINADGHIWIGNWDDRNMVLIDPETGGPLNTYDDELPLWQAADGTSTYSRPIVGSGWPYGMAVDALGNLWVAQRGSRVGQYDARTGAHIMTYDFSFGTSFYGIAVDLDGNVWLGNWTSNGLVYLPRRAAVGGQLGIEECIDTLGAGTGSTCLATAARVLNPPGGVSGGTCSTSRGVAVDQAGTVWVNCFGDNSVMQATLDASGQPAYLGFYSVGNGPLGITATADGNIWTVNQSGGGPNRLGSADGYSCPNGYNPDSGGTATRLRGSDGSVIATYPTCGSGPYTYSDLAGYTLRSVTLRSGFWRQRYDAGATIDYRRVEWDLAYPATTEIEVRFHASDNPDGLDTEGFSCGPYLIPADQLDGIDFADLGCDLLGRYFWADLRLFTRNDFLGPVIEEVRLFRECTGGETEICDGFDNDCDGLVDAADPDLPLGVPCNTGLPGICAQGLEQCQGGEWACVATTQPEVEVCDEALVDEDCDGESNEGVTNACGTCGLPPTEVCNLVDDDCDGFVDEGLRAICVDYGDGPDRCSTFINPACGACPPAPPEICGDGIDNNCNGLEDEGVARPCIDYAPGPNQCGVVQACGECPAPPAESCDGEDNNCNGLVDEGVQNVCFNYADCSTYQQCEACPEAPEELCDGLDNNCDGAIDEGVRNACGQCIEDVPEETQCDGVDNDCDGEIDEGLTNACGFCGEVPREVCDGIDNDCDGQVDEGVSNACGTCGPAPLEVCNNLDDDCDGTVDEGVRNQCGTCGPVPPEICDGADNDCDGETDEGTDPQCDAERQGAVCVFGECALPCFAGECAVGEICRDDYCIQNPCFGVTCDTGFRCVDGECESLCVILDITCEGDLVCVGGNCVEDVCSNTGCGPGFVCVENACVQDRCFEVECGTDEICSNGECIEDPCLEVSCDSGFQCVDGDCVDLCEEVICGRSEVCEGGFCVVDACFEVNCPEGTACIEGNCVEDDCVDVVCGTGQVCDGGECVTTRVGGACGAGLSRCGDGLFCYEGTCRDVNDPELADAGIDPDNPGGGGGQAAPASESCGCGAAGASASTPGLLLLVVGGLWLRRRRRGRDRVGGEVGP